MRERRGGWLGRLFGRGSGDGGGVDEAKREQEAQAGREREAARLVQQGQSLELRAMASGNPAAAMGEVLATYERALELNPRSAAAWTRKAFVFGLLGRFDESIAAVDRAVEADPRSEEAWVQKAMTLGMVRRADESIACSDRALELNPDSTQAWMTRGSALADAARFDEAVACFEKARGLGTTEADRMIAACTQAMARQPTRDRPTEPSAPPAKLGHETTLRGNPEVAPQDAPADQQVTERAAEDRAPEIRVFISSTFRDLQDEREHLIKRVFPEVRHTCRARGVELTEIDLRWGVTEEEARQGKVIKICLDEITRCRPYFIGILGRRYGWTPAADDVAHDPELLEAYPWVTDAVAAGRSVTEMEILHGVLENPAMAEHAFFYFRAPAASGEGADGEDREAARLADLKQRIRASGFPVREGVADVESLGRLVREDLMSVVEQRYPAESGPTPLERERRSHQAFAANRRRAYVEDPDLFGRLDDRVDGDGPPLVVVGEAGAGKSALLAAWSERHRRQRSGAFVVEHYVGAGTADTDHAGLLRHVIEEIRARYHVDDPLPATPEQLERELPSWLGRVRGERLVLVLDGLNQLEGNAVHLAWLPIYLPAEVRLIVSTLDGPAREALRGRGWSELVVRPLSAGQRDAVAGRYLGQYRKSLDEAQRRRLRDSPPCANPLFLRTLLEELRVFGSFEALDARLDQYLTATDPADLFQRVLERMESDYGTALLRDLVEPLWAARRGLTESELLELTGRGRLDLSTVLLALDYHLLRRDGLLAFFHDYLRQAVRARYLPEPEQQAAAHRRLADFFEPQPRSARRTEELPWQLRQAEAWERLRDCLADVSDRSTSVALLQNAETYELLGYWLALGERDDLAETYRESLARYEASGPEPNELLRRLNLLGQFLRHAGRYAAADDFFRRLLTLAEQSGGSEDAGTAVALHNLALARDVQGDYVEAETLERRALAIRERALGPEHVETSISLNTLAMILNHRGDGAAAEPLFRRALAIREQAFGGDDAACMAVANNLAALLGARGAYDEAEALWRRVVATWERVLGPNDPETGRALANLGFLLDQRGRLDQAEPLLRRSLAVRERALGPDHADTAHSAALLGELVGNRGDAAGAEVLFRRALAAQERALGPEHPNVAGSLDRLAGLLDDRGDYAAADELYRRALAIKERALGPEHASTALTLSNLGYLLLKTGNQAAAEPLLRRALEVRERALGPEHPDTAVSINNLAGLLHERGDLDGAEALLRRSLAIHEQAFGPDHPDTAQVRFNIGTLLHWRRDAAGAEALYRQALATLERVAPNHPDLADKLGELASVQAGRGDLPGAEESLRRALAIQEQAFGTEHPATLTNRNNLGGLLVQTGQLAEAASLLQRSLSISERTLGPDHPDTQRARQFLEAISQRLRLRSDGRPK